MCKIYYVLYLCGCTTSRRSSFRGDSKSDSRHLEDEEDATLSSPRVYGVGLHYLRHAPSSGVLAEAVQKIEFHGPVPRLPAHSARFCFSSAGVGGLVLPCHSRTTSTQRCSSVSPTPTVFRQRQIRLSKPIQGPKNPPWAGRPIRIRGGRPTHSKHYLAVPSVPPSLPTYRPAKTPLGVRSDPVPTSLAQPQQTGARPKRIREDVHGRGVAAFTAPVKELPYLSRLRRRRPAPLKTDSPAEQARGGGASEALVVVPRCSPVGRAAPTQFFQFEEEAARPWTHWRIAKIS
ncbi:hypothetical protein F4818DRAFT_454834 [Hypoxylon cercidicola]|nr:hypothetical protein F4818DRAFT_454834 [Hypoxylon cercidicola]